MKLNWTRTPFNEVPNVYLNSLDQFVKLWLKCRHYLRYCDDFVLLSRDRAELLEWRERIREHLPALERLWCHHPPTKKASQGFNNP
jgi:hypothetical protein